MANIKTIGSDVSPVQQPILINGGELPPVNVFHNPLWMNSNKPEEANQSKSIEKLNDLNAQLDAELSRYKSMYTSKGKSSSVSEDITIGKSDNIRGSNKNSSFLKLNESNINNSNSNNSYPKFTQLNSNSALSLTNNSNSNSNSNTNSNNLNRNFLGGANSNTNVNTNFLSSQNQNSLNNNNLNISSSLSNTNTNTNSLRYNDYYSNNQNNSQNINFPRIASLEPKFLETKVDFIDKESNTPLCIRREGMLKIRDADQKDKDVVVTYAVLTKDRLSYFVNAKDESSIQGSIELDKIKESLKLINGFPSCFTVKTLDNVSDCSICAESEDSAREWINAITQNAVNCNTLSALNNLNRRGLLK